MWLQAHAVGRTSEVSRGQGLLNGTGGNELADLRHEADGLFEGHEALAAVGHVVVGEGATHAQPYSQRNKRFPSLDGRGQGRVETQHSYRMLRGLYLRG